MYRPKDWIESVHHPCPMKGDAAALGGKRVEEMGTEKLFGVLEIRDLWMAA